MIERWRSREFSFGPAKVTALDLWFQGATLLLGLSSTKICSASPAPAIRKLCLGSNVEAGCLVQNESVTSLLPPPLDQLRRGKCCEMKVRREVHFFNKD